MNSKGFEKTDRPGSSFLFLTIGRPDVLGVKMFWVRNSYRVFGKLQEILSEKTPFPFRFVTSRWSLLAMSYCALSEIVFSKGRTMVYMHILWICTIDA